jgi:hypothetical protein
VAVATVSIYDNIDITGMTSDEFFKAMKSLPHVSKSGLNLKRLRKNNSKDQFQGPRIVHVKRVIEEPSASKPYLMTAVKVNSVSLHAYRPWPMAMLVNKKDEHLAMCRVLTQATREKLAIENGRKSIPSNANVSVCCVSRPIAASVAVVAPVKEVVRVVVEQKLSGIVPVVGVSSVPARGQDRVVVQVPPNGVMAAKPVVKPKIARFDTDVMIPVRDEGEEIVEQSASIEEDMTALLVLLEGQETEAMVRDQCVDPFLGAVYRYRQDKTKDPVGAKVSMECSRSERKFIEKGIEYFFISDDGRLWNLRYKLADGTKGVPRSARLCIPNCRTKEVLEGMHRVGHLSPNKLLRSLRARFYWRFMVTDVKNFSDACVVCQQRVGKQGKFGKLQPIVARVRNMLVSCDHSGPYPQTALGNKYILVFTDHFSRFVELVAVKDLTAETTARAFIQYYVQRHGIPFYLLSDKGAAFTAGLFRLVCTILGVHKLFTTAYHPQCNGMTERFNRTMNTMLAKLVDVKCNDWDGLKLSSIQSAYNNLDHPATQNTPQYVLSGYECTLPADLIFFLENAKRGLGASSIQSDLTFAAEAYRIAQALAIENAETASSNMADYYNKSRIDPTTVFQVGGKVWFYANPIKNLTPKLINPWIGPFRIDEIVSENLYRVSDVRTGQAIDQVVSSRRLKPYVANFRPLQAPDFEIEDSDEFFLKNESLGTNELVSALQDLANRRTAFAQGKKVTNQMVVKKPSGSKFLRGKVIPAVANKPKEVIVSSNLLPIIVEPSVEINPNAGNHLFQSIFQEHPNNVVLREPSLGKDAVVAVSASNELPAKSDIIAVGVPKSQVAIPIGLANVLVDMVVPSPVMASVSVDANAHVDLRRGDDIAKPPFTNSISTPILSHPNPIHKLKSQNLVEESDLAHHSPVVSSRIVGVNRSCILPMIGGALPHDTDKVKLVSKSESVVAVSPAVVSRRAASKRVINPSLTPARWRS